MLLNHMEELKRRRRQGLSLPFVACAGALLLALALALVYTAGLMLSNANTKLKEERCYQLAESFAQVLDQELREPGVTSPNDKKFYTFVNNFLEKPEYNAYNPDNPATVYHYALAPSAGVSDEDYGDIRIQLRKEANEDETRTLTRELEIPTSDLSNYSQKIADLQSTTFQRYILTVEVTAQLGDLSYDYATEYYREDVYDLKFTYEGDTIVWDTREGMTGWKKGTTEGDPCTFDDPSAKIIGTYMTDKATSRKYVPMHKERSGS